MKHPRINSAFTIVAIFLFLGTLTAGAQRLNVWKGGTPGHETDWNYFKNWTLGKTPNEFDRVLIPDVSTTTRAYPVVSNAGVEISSLEIQTGATVTIKPNAWIQTDVFENSGECKGCNKRLKVRETGTAVAVAH